LSELSAVSCQPLSLYIHIPWCLHKCGYCDFNSHATEANAFPEDEYVDALIADLAMSKDELRGRSVQSIFIGGGTPSLFSAAAIAAILNACQQQLKLSTDCEITLETNPGTFEGAKFADFKLAGVNRLSIGVQSFDPEQLKALERIHGRDEALHAVRTAQQLGFDNINIDLMFALPGQSIEQALSDVAQACALDLPHLSYYQLTIEPNTRFHRFPPAIPSLDQAADIQAAAMSAISDAGYQRYEVSAFSQTEAECRHNLNYWQFGDYLGLGAGAHSKLTTGRDIKRFQRVRQPGSYLKAVAQHKQVIQPRILGSNDLIFEFMLNQLRLRRGFTQLDFERRTQLQWQDTIAAQVSHLLALGHLEQANDRYFASAHAYCFLDSLIQEFLEETP